MAPPRAAAEKPRDDVVSVQPPASGASTPSTRAPAAGGRIQSARRDHRITPGSAITVGGVTATWPDVPAGKPKTWWPEASRMCPFPGHQTPLGAETTVRSG